LLATFVVAVFPPSGSNTRPAVRLILPLPAASATDTVARIVAQAMSQSLGQQV
jgi:tripartite-type tricarboxylate transporter receptor subunit TctC